MEEDTKKNPMEGERHKEYPPSENLWILHEHTPWILFWGTRPRPFLTQVGLQKGGQRDPKTGPNSDQGALWSPMEPSGALWSLMEPPKR